MSMDMDVEPLPTVDELTAWMRMPRQAIAMAEKIAADAFCIRQALCGVYTMSPIGVWWNDTTSKAAVYLESDLVSDRDEALVKSAVSRVADCLDEPLPTDTIPGAWIKVAYSPTLRRAGELLNFFPGKYPGGIPNSPGPVQGMLTSGLVGAGLGYGAGWAGEQLLPEKWRRGRLRKTLAVLGALPGAALGGLYMGSNAMSGLPITSNKLLDGPPPAVGEMYKGSCDAYAARWREKTAEAVKDAFGDTFGSYTQDDHPRGPMDINVDAMGRLLWDTGASPQTAGMTMGAIAAAQQMPGGHEEPGWVTPGQMAGLAAHMGAGYVSGAIVGSVLGLLTGMPDETQEKLRQTGLYLGVVQAVVPKLFSR